jgi:cystathionine beta-lyase
MTFDTQIDRRGTDCSKWDLMDRAFGVSPQDGLAMWIADMDFATPDFLQAAAQGIVDRDHYGYFCGLETYEDAIIDWMATRHGWTLDRDWMFTTYGLGNGIAITLNALTAPGDEVIIFTPVYHEFAAKIAKTGRVVRELPLVLRDGMYAMDFGAYAGMLSGREKMVIACSPHNPAGRVWTQAELTALATFCQTHDLLLISDEIHADLTFAGHTHLPMHLAAPQIADRLVMMTSASKTFNIAGARTGCVSIPDPALRARFSLFFRGLDMQPNLLGVALTRAAYSAEGAAWCDELCAYLEENARVFAAGVNAIPGLTMMPMQSTYLSWVDFAGTGMARAEFHDRVYGKARIAATPGHTLGTGGETFLRFNLGTNRARILEAVDRLSQAFGDLQ